MDNQETSRRFKFKTAQRFKNVRYASEWFANKLSFIHCQEILYPEFTPGTKREKDISFSEVATLDKALMGTLDHYPDKSIATGLQYTRNTGERVIQTFHLDKGHITYQTIDKNTIIVSFVYPPNRRHAAKRFATALVDVYRFTILD